MIKNNLNDDMVLSKNKNELAVNGKKFKKIIDRDIISNVVSRLSAQINKDYSNKHIYFIVVLKGAVFFASDLLRAINVDCELDFIRASSYGNSMTNSKLETNLEGIDVKGKDVVIIEDIIDTGKTLFEIIAELNKLEPLSVEAVTFLSKPDKRKVDINIKYIGIEIPENFVIGYGMDYAQEGRHLPDIYTLIN